MKPILLVVLASSTLLFMQPKMRSFKNKRTSKIVVTIKKNN